MKKFLKRLAHSALAMVLAVSLTPLPAFADAESGAIDSENENSIDLVELLRNDPSVHHDGLKFYLSKEVTLQSGTYHLPSNVWIYTDTKGELTAPGLGIAEGASVTIVLNKWGLFAHGSDAIAGGNGDNGGNAESNMNGKSQTTAHPSTVGAHPGILLPASSTLTIKGSGTFEAYGGNGSNGGNGGNGGNGYAEPHFVGDDYYGGGGGSGGGAGSGAAPGVGTRGSVGSATTEPAAVAERAGDLIIAPDFKDSIRVDLKGGVGGNSGVQGTPGADKYKKDYTGKCWGGGGGAGGAGGGGGAASGYGDGGSGGTSGAPGALGERDCDEKGSKKGGAELCGADGVSGGPGTTRAYTTLPPAYGTYSVQTYYMKDGKYQGCHLDQFTAPVGQKVSLTQEQLTPKEPNYVLDSDYNDVDAHEAVIDADKRAILNVHFKSTYTVSFKAGEHGTLRLPDNTTQSEVVYSDVPHGTPLSAIPTPVPNEGWQFLGWSKPVSSTVTENATYEAMWVEAGDADYTVQFFLMSEDGTYPAEPSAINTRTAKAGAACMLSGEDAQPVGMTGYLLDPSAEGSHLEDTVAADGSTVLKAYFSRVFDVTYAPGLHGTFPEETFYQHYYGSTTPSFGGEPTAEEGWHFAVWSPTVADTITSDAIYTALWEPDTNISYTVKSYYMQNGSYEGVTPVVQQYDNGTTAQQMTLSAEQLAPQQESYALDRSQPCVTEAVIAADGSTEFVLYFKHALTVTFASGDHGSFVGGGTKRTIEGLDYGAAVPEAPEIVADPGWIANGWTPSFSADTTVTSNITYTVNWIPDQNVAYTVEAYYEEDGYLNPRDVYDYQGTAGELVSVTEKDKDPQVANHVFDADSPNNVLEGTIAADGSTVLKVYFKRSAEPVTKGDVNNSGRMNIVDAQITYDIAVGNYAEKSDEGIDLLAKLNIPGVSRATLHWAADFDGDWTIDAIDAFAIQYYIHYGTLPPSK